jgi:hypothetical protein
MAQLSSKSEKVLITGDDILIEYCERLMNCLKHINETMLKVSWRTCIDKFITHKVWHNSELKSETNLRPSIWQKLETRLQEMIER